jgi:long-chain acyl-CoA synthetase
MIAGVPALFAAIAREKRHGRDDFSSIKVCVSGGDALPIAVKHTFEERTGCPLAEGYGLTECAPVVACSNPLERMDKPGYVGLPLPRTKVEIVSLEDRRTVLPAGEVGEICVSGPQVMRGYLNQQAASAEALRDGRLHTGDVGRLDGDGFLMFVDRLKEVIVVRGYKVYPSELEATIRRHPAIADAAVVGAPDAERGAVPWAYVALLPGGRLTTEELLAFLSDKLSPVERPRRIEFVATLPRSPIGKVLKGELLGERPAN